MHSYLHGASLHFELLHVSVSSMQSLFQQQMPSMTSGFSVLIIFGRHSKALMQALLHPSSRSTPHSSKTLAALICSFFACINPSLQATNLFCTDLTSSILQQLHLSQNRTQVEFYYIQGSQEWVQSIELSIGFLSFESFDIDEVLRLILAL